jgi:hypothetical protein
MVVKENKYSILFYSILKLCEGHLAMSGQQEPVLLLSMSKPQRPRGLSCTWTCLQYSFLCCTEMCLHHKGLNYTCTCLDNRSLCCSWVSTPPGKELHLAMFGQQEPVLLLSMSKPPQGLSCTWTCLHYNIAYAAPKCVYTTRAGAIPVLAWTIGACAAPGCVQTTPQ